MVNLSAKSDAILGLTDADYNEASVKLGCEIEVIKAVSEVEARGSGFLPSKRPKILFEGHYFYRNLRQYGLAETVAKTNPSICYSKWTKAYYKGGEAEYTRLVQALEICKKYEVPAAEALKSASWGRYQIMGANFQKCGYRNVEDFVEDIFKSEKYHLLAFCEFVINSFLDDELRNKDFAKFAYGYNGSQYAQNQYDKKMLAAYNKYKKESAANVKYKQTAPLRQPDVNIIEVNAVDDSQAQLLNIPSTQADKPAIAITPIQSTVKNIANLKQLVIGLTTALGLSGTSMTALNFHWFSNPNVQLAILAVVVAGIVAAIVVGIIWLKSQLDFQHQITLKQKEAEREYNLEVLRIRANPNLYNVEYKDVQKENI